jgi:hypothetical protein
VHYYGKTLLGRMSGYLARVPTGKRPRNLVSAPTTSEFRPPTD